MVLFGGGGGGALKQIMVFYNFSKKIKKILKKKN